jgi:small subunit ribosomal protein S6
MNKYEVLYIVNASLDDAAKEATIEKYSALVTANGGEVESVDKWGVKKFAYPIDYKNEGYYVLMNIDAPATAVVEMERLMRLDENLLRYLTTKVDALEEGPSIMLEPKYKKSKADDKFDIEVGEGE